MILLRLVLHNIIERRRKMNTFPRILVVLFNVLSYLHGYVLTYVEIFINIIVVFIKLIFSRKSYFLLLEVSIFFFLWEPFHSKTQWTQIFFDGVFFFLVK